MTNKNEPFVLEGKAFYLQPTTPNELSGKYQMDLSIDSITAERLKTLGVSVKSKTDEKTGKPDIRGTYVTLQRAATKKDGTKMTGPKVVDSEKNEIPETVLIGNGSTVKVVTHVFEWKFKNKSGSSLGLDIVQVMDLVPYENKSMNLLG